MKFRIGDEVIVTGVVPGSDYHPSEAIIVNNAYGTVSYIPNWGDGNYYEIEFCDPQGCSRFWFMHETQITKMYNPIKLKLTTRKFRQG